MKNKTVAALLAFMGGYAGIHRFYLGEVGKGIGYIFLLPILLVLTKLWAIPFIIGFIDGAKLLSMPQEEFDKKYNGIAPGFDEDQTRQQQERQYQNRRVNRRKQQRPEYSPKRSNPQTVKAKSEKALKQGIAYFKDFDFEEALKYFSKALKVDPGNAAVHFNLACTHSLLENKDKGFYHLDRAVALGLNDFEIIKTRDHLAFLRVQDEWEQFAANSFRLAPQIVDTKPEADAISKQAPPKQQTQTADLLEQLQQLAQLKEKGLLTEEEFKVQKEKILR